MSIVDTDVEAWLMLNVGDVETRRRLGGSGWTSTCVYGVKRVRPKGDESDFASYFVKTSPRPVGDVFEGEAFGLKAMAATTSVKVPKVSRRTRRRTHTHLYSGRDRRVICTILFSPPPAPAPRMFWFSSSLSLHTSGSNRPARDGDLQPTTVCVGRPQPTRAATHTCCNPHTQVLHYAAGSSSGSYIIMEALKFASALNQAVFGRQMAEMHLAKPLAPQAQEGRFGFPVTNRIGDTVQPNAWYLDWVDFFREQRIGHQLKLAKSVRLNEWWDRVLDVTEGLGTLFEGIKVCAR